MRIVVSLLSAALVACVSPAFASGSSPTPATLEDPSAAPAEVAEAQDGVGKLDRSLERVLATADPLEAAKAEGYRTRDSRIQVVVRCASEDEAAELAGRLESDGARHVLRAYEDVQAFVDPSAIAALAELGSVRRVHQPTYLSHPEPPLAAREARRPEAAVTATSEGLANMNVAAWHAAGKTGGGFRIAVVDTELGGYASLLGTELPPQARVTYKAYGGAQLVASEPHGTACAEIITDIVPGIDQMFLGLIATTVDLAAAIQEASALGYRVISNSTGAAGFGPEDGSEFDSLAKAINDFSRAGGLFFTSAGNEAEHHWEQTWTDGDGDGIMGWNSTGSDERNYLGPGPGQFYNIPVGYPLQATLKWNQWQGPTTDLRLRLRYVADPVNNPNNVVAVKDADATQSGSPSQVPMEKLTHVATQAGAYYFSVNRQNSGPLAVDMEFFSNVGLMTRKGQGSLAYPADLASAVAVAAADAGTQVREPYSSMGPANGPGGSLTGGATKPDMAGYANVSTTSYGARGTSNQFNGTSSACPHVAGAAALYWSANPGKSAADVLAYLAANAIGSGGKTNDMGYGLVRLGTPTSSQAGCTPGATTLCLNSSRFQVQTTWRTEDGKSGAGQAKSLTGDTGYFTFFDASNVEMVVKTLNACFPPFNYYWVFAAGLTNVEVQMTVTDTKNGTVKRYTNPLGTAFQPIQDTSAFATCP